jgi:predicted transcriptional regulator
MYRANLNFDRFHRYFGDLLRRGFIEEVNNGNGRMMYKITERGMDFLEVLKKAQELALSEKDV